MLRRVEFERGLERKRIGREERKRRDVRKWRFRGRKYGPAGVLIVGRSSSRVSAPVLQRFNAEGKGQKRGGRASDEESTRPRAHGGRRKIGWRERERGLHREGNEKGRRGDSLAPMVLLPSCSSPVFPWALDRPVPVFFRTRSVVSSHRSLPHTHTYTHVHSYTHAHTTHTRSSVHVCCNQCGEA